MIGTLFQDDLGNEAGMCWQATWTQAMKDFRGDDEEQPFTDVT
jgi:hypothetical protein